LALVVSVGFVLGGLVLGETVAAQTARRAQTPLQQARAALLEGRYDEVESLVAPLGPNDPGAAALKARALEARGRYGEAEAVLRPVATRAPMSIAALELGMLLKMLGRADATAMLTRIAAQSTDPLVEARARRALGDFKNAQEAFRAAVSRAPTDPEANTEWGELFLDAHNNADAVKSFQIALEADPKWTPALFGAAVALADDDPPQAMGAARKALEVNPSYAEAHVLLARQAMDQDKKDEARAALEKALAVNPSSLEAHATLAAIAYVEDRKSDFEAEVAKVLAISPTYAEVYRVTAELTSHNYRTDEAAALVRRAVDLQPRDARALSDLGGQLLRTGDETGALQALEAAYKLDPYDARTVNMLRLLDTLDKFVTVTDGEFIFRFSKDEADVVKEYAIPLAHKAIDNYKARYEFTPKGPILVEIFPKHDDFAVRNVGLPGMIGALGACFGRVVAMDSPKAKTVGNFQWEATLWHELAHVITIQMTNQRVPRWLTEGISEFEQKRERPEWARQMDLEFAASINEGKVFKLRDLNAAFTDPRKISMAYFQGSVVVDYLVETYGPSGLNKLLRAYGQGLDTTAALKSTLDTDFDQMQAGFDKLLERRFGAVARALKGGADEGLGKKSSDELKAMALSEAGSYRIQLALGSALRKSGDVDAAMRAFEAAAALVPIDSRPHEEIAAIALEKKDRPRAIAELQRVVDTDFDNIAAARALASEMKQGGITDAATVRGVNERIIAIDPFDNEAHSVLGRLAMARNDSAVAAREFKVALLLNPVNRAEAYTDLAESFLSLGKKDEAKKQTLAALEIAPTYGRAQGLLLKIVEPKP
jgi:tetratricopeptide (TPR) repeat protein